MIWPDQSKVVDDGETRQDTRKQRKWIMSESEQKRMRFSWQHAGGEEKKCVTHAKMFWQSQTAHATEQKDTLRCVGESQPHAAGTHLADPGGIAGWVDLCSLTDKFSLSRCGRGDSENQGEQPDEVSATQIPNNWNWRKAPTTNSLCHVLVCAAETGSHRFWLMQFRFRFVTHLCQ